MKWLSSFDYRLSFQTSFYQGAGTCYARPSIVECSNTSAASEIWAHTPDGRKVRYVKAPDGVFYEDKASPVAKIVRQANGTWVLYGDESQIETYSVGGYPLTIRNAAGVGWSFRYGGLNNTQLQQVTHTSERSVEFVWVDDELREVRDPASRAYRFTYTGQGTAVGIHLLKTSASPGTPSTDIAYHYDGEAGEPQYNTIYTSGYALTGKSHNGVRYSTFRYEVIDGRLYGSSTEHAGGVEKYIFSYAKGAEDLLTVAETNPLGKRASYVFKAGKAQSVTGLPSNSCAGAYKETQYDPNGNEDLVADFNGNFINYDYHPSGQLQKQVEAFGTPQARTTTYLWDSSVNRILRVTVEGLRQTDYTYAAGNRVASVAVTNLSSNGLQGQVLTTQYAYTVHPNGLLATAAIDGPLSADTVISTYNVTGDLIEVRNSLGHATTYSNHNALGQPGRVTGPNGGITEFVYDARGRVTLVRTYANGVASDTQYRYGADGLLASTVTPDGVEVKNVYDSARRLVEKYHREAGGTYARTQYIYNAMSLPTTVQVIRSDYPWNTTITGNIDGLGTEAGNYVIRGWACSTGSNAPIDVHLYLGGPAGSGQGIGGYLANQSSEPAVAAACQAGGATYRFSIPVSTAMREQHGGKSIYIHGISPAGQSNSLISSSGAYVIPILPPANAPTPSAPNQSTSGSYTVSWTSVANASSYQLDESTNGGTSWTLIHDAAGTSKLISGKSAGTYSYRARACNTAGCGPTSGVVSVVEIDPPTAAPAVTAPGVNTTGSYTVSWTGVAGATSYQLDEAAEGGAWALIVNAAVSSTALSRSTSITYSYRARACNAAGCGPTSGSVGVQKIVYGAQYVDQSIPASIQPGEVAAASVRMRNTGNTTWTAAEAYRLGSQNVTDNMRWGLNRVAVAGSVAPGQIATFNFSITGPTPSAEGGEGMRAFQWRMVREGVTWFGDQSPNTGIWLDAPGPDPDQCGGRPYCHEN